MQTMYLISKIAIYIEIILLLYVAFIDIAVRLIYNQISFSIFILGVIHQLLDISYVLESVIMSSLLFVMLIFIYIRGWIGGGDVKLLTAVSIGMPSSLLIQFLTMTALSGGILAIIHLFLRHLPAPELVSRRASLLNRIYIIERWRHTRKAPLPYGAAIACGSIWTALNSGF